MTLTFRDLNQVEKIARLPRLIIQCQLPNPGDIDLAPLTEHAVLRMLRS